MYNKYFLYILEDEYFMTWSASVFSVGDGN